MTLEERVTELEKKMAELEKAAQPEKVTHTETPGTRELLDWR